MKEKIEMLKIRRNKLVRNTKENANIVKKIDRKIRKLEK